MSLTPGAGALPKVDFQGWVHTSQDSLRNRDSTLGRPLVCLLHQPHQDDAFRLIEHLEI